MKLSQLLSSVEIEQFCGNTRVEISDLSYDSRKVKPGSLFVAIPGFKEDGHRYIPQALALGAKAIVVQEWQEELAGVPQILVKDSRKALAVLSNNFFGNPSSKLRLIGVTGTNGKTTTTYLLEKIFLENGEKTGLLGTIEYRIGRKSYPAEKTTPESLDLQKVLAKMVREKVKTVIMEVSSHALDLKRIDGCNFQALVFTNLSRDHLDYHGDLEAYFRAKARFFTDQFNQGVSFINLDDSYGRRLRKILKNRKVLTYGLRPEAEFRARGVKVNSHNLDFKLAWKDAELPLSSPLKGIFNIHNVLAAASVAFFFEVPPSLIKKGIAKVKRIPGRFEYVNQGQDFQVVVDYAHTPDGLEKVLKAARESGPRQIITLFGCGGDRDKTKRPLMGKVAAQLSDYLIITSDNPRSESPEKIIGEIIKGIGGEFKEKWEIVVDRQEAISKGIKRAKKGDLVLIAGKGHERSQVFSDKVVPFNDFEVASKILKELK